MQGSWFFEALGSDFTIASTFLMLVSELDISLLCFI